MANYIFKFFIEEFKNKYPELNKSIYKGNMSINDIDKGINPTIKYITVKNKDGDNLTVQIRKNDNIKNIIKIVKNMTKLEYDEYSKEKTQKLYKLSDEIEKNEKLKIEKKINDLFKKYNINLLPTEWEKFGFRLIGNINYDFIIEFRYKNDISNIINKLIENEIDFDYNIKFEGVKNGFRTDSYKYYRIKSIKK
jgi:hypothetical protein